MSASAKPALDRIDIKILRELQADARLRNVVLAERVGLSPSPCLRRVKLLEEVGAIEGYRTVLDRPSVGLGLTVFAGIRVERHTDANADAFVSAVLAMPEVRDHLVPQRLSVQTSSPEQLGTLQRTDQARWRKVIADAKITAD